MTHVHYKFSSKRSYNTVVFDGVNITLCELKRLIMTREKLRAADCDLEITDAQTKEEYTDSDCHISKGSSVIVRRVPSRAIKSNSSANNSGRSETYNCRSGFSKPPMDGQKSTGVLPFFSQMADLTTAEVSEDHKIKTIMTQSCYDSADYQKYGAPLPANYICYRCGSNEHHIRNCPLSMDKNTEPAMKIKKSTGIPRSFMVKVDDPSIKGAMLTNTGHYAVPVIDAEAYAVVKKKLPAQEPQLEDPSDVAIPNELLCLICKDLLNDAVVIPCCGNSYCDDCIRSALLDSEDHVCPTCSQSDVSPDTLIANKFLRQAVNNFTREQICSQSIKSTPSISRSQDCTPQPSPVPTPPPPPQSQPERSPVTDIHPVIISESPLCSSTSLNVVKALDEMPEKEADMKKDSSSAASPSAFVSEAGFCDSLPQPIPLVTAASQAIVNESDTGSKLPCDQALHWERATSGSPSEGWPAVRAHPPALPSITYSLPHSPNIIPSSNVQTYLEQQPLSRYPSEFITTPPQWTSLHSPQRAPIPAFTSSTTIPPLLPKELMLFHRRNKERTPPQGSSYNTSRLYSSKPHRSKSSRSSSRSPSQTRPQDRARGMSMQSHYSHSQGSTRSQSPTINSPGSHSQRRSRSPVDRHKSRRRYCSRSRVDRHKSHRQDRTRSPADLLKSRCQDRSRSPEDRLKSRHRDHSRTPADHFKSRRQDRSRSPEDRLKSRHQGHSRTLADHLKNRRQDRSRSPGDRLKSRRQDRSRSPVDHLKNRSQDHHCSHRTNSSSSSWRRKREAFEQCYDAYLRWKQEYADWCEKYFNSYFSQFHQMPPPPLMPPPQPHWSNSPQHHREPSPPSSDSRSSNSQSYSERSSTASTHSSSSYRDSTPTPSCSDSNSIQGDDCSREPHKPQNINENQNRVKESGMQTIESSHRMKWHSKKISKHESKVKEKKAKELHLSRKEKERKSGEDKDEKRHKVKTRKETPRTDAYRSRQPGHRKSTDLRSEKSKKVRDEETSGENIQIQSSSSDLFSKVLEREKPKKAVWKPQPLTKENAWEGGVKVKTPKKINININLDGNKNETDGPGGNVFYHQVDVNKPGEPSPPNDGRKDFKNDSWETLPEDETVGEEDSDLWQCALTAVEKKEEQESAGAMEEDMKPYQVALNSKSAHKRTSLITDNSCLKIGQSGNMPFDEDQQMKVVGLGESVERCSLEKHSDPIKNFCSERERNHSERGPQANVSSSHREGKEKAKRRLVEIENSQEIDNSARSDGRVAPPSGRDMTDGSFDFDRKKKKRASRVKESSGEVRSHKERESYSTLSRKSYDSGQDCTFVKDKYSNNKEQDETISREGESHQINLGLDKMLEDKHAVFNRNHHDRYKDQEVHLNWRKVHSKSGMRDRGQLPTQPSAEGRSPGQNWTCPAPPIAGSSRGTTSDLKTTGERAQDSRTQARQKETKNTQGEETHQS